MNNHLLHSILRPIGLYAVYAMMAMPIASATILISEDFSGLATDLDGKTPTTVDPALSGITWVAGSSGSGSQLFQRNGVIEANNKKALLDFGTFIEDKKGQADAIFTVSATVEPTGSGNDWIAIGFYRASNSASALAEMPGVDGATGVTLYRANGDAEGFIEGPGIVRGDFATGSGAQTYGVTLDLSTWNGTDNWGSLTFQMGGTSSTAYNLSSGQVDFQAIGIGTPSNGSGTITNFEFTQIPEPQTLLLMVGAFVTLLVFRRRR